MSNAALTKLCKISGIVIPKSAKILPEYWSAQQYCRLGAQRRYEIYGQLGTPEGRRKGGIASQRLFRKNPEFAKECGVIVRKKVNIPFYSAELAEFIGIMLGDGGMSFYQINITVNSETDKEYAEYIRALVKKLFSIQTVVLLRKNESAVRIIASARNLIEFLQNCGLKTGNKIKNKIDVPNWIIQRREYRLSCIRGIFDTDGSCYFYNHKVNNKTYRNFALCFTSYSKPLIKSIYNILKDEHCDPVIAKNRIYIHRNEGIKKYFNEIGTHNAKHLYKYENYRGLTNN